MNTNEERARRGRSATDRIREALLNATGAYEALELTGAGRLLPGIGACRSNTARAVALLGELEQAEHESAVLAGQADLYKRFLWHVLSQTGPVSVSEVALVRFDPKKSWVEHTVHPDGSHTLRAVEDPTEKG